MVRDRKYRSRSRSKGEGMEKSRKRSASPSSHTHGRAEKKKREGYRLKRRSAGDEGVSQPDHPQQQRGRTQVREDSQSYEDELVKVMGFGSFSSTKNKKVGGAADMSGVSKNKKVQYRQYINREGGFNRELSPPPSKK